MSLEYLPEAIKEEGSSSESNISRIKNIISSVQTLDAYRKSNDPVYTDKYNGTLKCTNEGNQFVTKIMLFFEVTD